MAGMFLLQSTVWCYLFSKSWIGLLSFFSSKKPGDKEEEEEETNQLELELEEKNNNEKEEEKQRLLEQEEAKRNAEEEMETEEEEEEKPLHLETKKTADEEEAKRNIEEEGQERQELTMVKAKSARFLKARQNAKEVLAAVRKYEEEETQRLENLELEAKKKDEEETMERTDKKDLEESFSSLDSADTPTSDPPKSTTGSYRDIVFVPENIVQEKIDRRAIQKISNIFPETECSIVEKESVALGLPYV